MSIGSHHSPSPQTTSWLTPPFILEALGGRESFDLDPCMADNMPWQTAKAGFTIQDNGLRQRWHGRVWLNPPYTASEIGKWMARMVGHGTGTALVFARTETEWFTEHVFQAADGLLFLTGRLHFHVAADTVIEPKGKPPIHLKAGERYPFNSGAPSVLVAYGEEDTERLAASDLEGNFLPLTLKSLVPCSPPARSWAQEIGEYLASANRPVTLSELYRAFAAHRKSLSNPNYQAKIRQTLQRGRFNRLEPGLWSASSTLTGSPRQQIQTTKSHSEPVNSKENR